MADEQSSNFISNRFLRFPEEELDAYAAITDSNLKNIQQRKHTVLSNGGATLGYSASQKQAFVKFLEMKKENASNVVLNHEQKENILAVEKTINKKKVIVENLKQKLKHLTAQYERLMNERQHENQENRVSAAMYKKGLQVYKSRFQYTIEVGNVNDDTRYCVVITFFFKGEVSKYPIQFIFDKEANNLLSFDAGHLITAQLQEELHKRFKESGNLPALFCTLRHFASQRHTS